MESAPLPAPAHPSTFWNDRRTIAAAVALLVLQGVLAYASLVRENMTIDEPLHMTAGVSYWQQWSFRCYWHNPPLLRLYGALPVVLSGPNTEGLYDKAGWDLVQWDLGHKFAAQNANRYFDLCQRARLMMPALLLAGGALAFLWSRRLYGNAGGLVTLALWAVCPNLLAHGRLVTTDVGALTLGLAATTAFMASLRRPSWRRSALAGLLLGLACLSKFTNLMLFGLWPLIFGLYALGGLARPRLLPMLGRGALLIGVAVATIDAGYLFRGVGEPLGRYDFLSKALTVPRTPGSGRIPQTFNADHQRLYDARVNRFRGTWLGAIPVPFPREFVLGFDEQKFESEGIPKQLYDPTAGPDEVMGYPVFLDGVLRSTGWGDYYLRALLYKVPEGTLLLWAVALIATVVALRSRAAWAEEGSLLLMAGVPFALMTFGTDINIGLRYVLPMFPYLYILCGKLAPLAAGRAWAKVGLLIALAASAAGTLSAFPHFLAYFNWASGGPARGSEHLVDSNLDWGQDLIGLQEWAAKNAPGEKIGLAYFGQIHPNLLAARGEGMGLDWFLPPGRDGSMRQVNFQVEAPGELKPGLYAVSASLVRGLAWRLYDPKPGVAAFSWQAGINAYSYFAEFTPIGDVGHSIFLYRLTEEDARRWPELRKPIE